MQSAADKLADELQALRAAVYLAFEETPRKDATKRMPKDLRKAWREAGRLIRRLGYRDDLT